MDFYALYVGLASLSLGTLTGYLLIVIRRRLTIHSAKKHAEVLLKTSEERAQSLLLEVEERMKESSEQALRHFEKELSRKQETVDERESHLKNQVENWELDHRERQSQVDTEDNRVQSFERKIQDRKAKQESLKTKLGDLRSQWLGKLRSVSGESELEIRAEVETAVLNETKQRAKRSATSFVENADLDLEKTAKRALSKVLARFQRPYCAERGMNYLQLENDVELSRVLGPNQTHLKALEKNCGVDLIFDSEKRTVSISGFDPVRRELGRLSLEKAAADSQINEVKIPALVEKVKKELFAKILRDGERIAKELKIPGLHQEVKNMMGSLRYRYSFSQNQHFHCGEVGFLCGLLSSELGLPLEDGRRAGLLHDIGKAMDHSIDGGHAVIGADFIARHGEEPHIIHAVRAHHYDENPNSNLAYLVIAADAMSGARPGARRSTVDSYMQKMEDLENIGSSFPEVTATYVLSAGRELRLLVNGQKVDDWNAMELSKKVAAKIEAEMAYPGQIKVTVVRETHAVDYAR